MSAPIIMMQSNGGMLPIEWACRFPIHIIESGPAAGVMAAEAFARQVGLKNVVTFDMGGTTAKASIIEDGEIAGYFAYEVGGDISIGHRMMKGSGYLLRVPSIDIAEVSAGGGSSVWIDAAGALRVAWQRWRASWRGAAVAPRGARSQRLQTPMCTLRILHTLRSPRRRRAQYFLGARPACNFRPSHRLAGTQFGQCVLGPFDRLLMQA